MKINPGITLTLSKFVLQGLHWPPQNLYFRDYIDPFKICTSEITLTPSKFVLQGLHWPLQNLYFRDYIDLFKICTSRITLIPSKFVLQGLHWSLQNLYFNLQHAKHCQTNKSFLRKWNKKWTLHEFVAHSIIKELISLYSITKELIGLYSITKELIGLYSEIQNFYALLLKYLASL